MKLNKVLCCTFLFSFQALTMHKTQQLFATDGGTKQQKRFDYATHAQCMSAKQKILQGRGPSNKTLGIFVCSFDVARLHNHSPLFTMVRFTKFLTIQFLAKVYLAYYTEVCAVTIVLV